MNITDNPNDLKLSALRIGWSDSKGRTIYLSDEVSGQIQVRIENKAIWIPKETLQKMVSELVGKDAN